jgi:hypothetical protein
MSNIITIELCAEDRARLDRVIEALEHRPNCEGCVTAAVTMTKEAVAEATAPKPEAKDETPTTNSPEPEKPVETPTEHPLDASPIDEAPEAEAVDPPEEPKPSVSREEVRSKVVTLCAAGEKEEVKKIVTAYAAGVKDIPEDKLAEVLEKLTALEG